MVKKIPKLEVKCLCATGAWCYRLRPHCIWPHKIMAPHAPPQKNKGTGCASGHNWPQSNQPQLPSTVIGFRAINKTAIIKFEQAPACPWHCLSLQFICPVSYSFGCDERIRTAVINNVTHLMLWIVYSHKTIVTRAATRSSNDEEEKMSVKFLSCQVVSTYT